MRRKIAILVSAILLSIQLGSPLAAATPSVEQLDQISSFLAADDAQALRAYLVLHPELLNKKTALGKMLAEFMEKSASLVTFAGFGQSLMELVEAESAANSRGFSQGVSHSDNGNDSVLY